MDAKAPGPVGGAVHPALPRRAPTSRTWFERPDDLRADQGRIQARLLPRHRRIPHLRQRRGRPAGEADRRFRGRARPLSALPIATRRRCCTCSRTIRAPRSSGRTPASRTPPARVQELLEKYPALWGELSYRSGITDGAGKLSRRMARAVRAPFRPLPDRLRHLDQRALVRLRHDLQELSRLARAAAAPSRPAASPTATPSGCSGRGRSNLDGMRQARRTARTRPEQRGEHRGGTTMTRHGRIVEAQIVRQLRLLRAGSSPHRHTARPPQLPRPAALPRSASALPAGTIGAPAVRRRPPRPGSTCITISCRRCIARRSTKHKVGAPRWSPQMSLEDMDKSGIATSMLSQVQPGTWCGDDGGVAQAQPRDQRIRRQARARPSRPLRPVRDDPAARHRRQPEGDRIRLRHAQGRRHRPAHELRRQVSRRSVVRAGLRGAQPPQGGDLRASADAALLRQAGARAFRRARSNTPPTPRAPSRIWCSAARRRSIPDIRWIFSHSRRHAAVPHRALRPPADGAEARASAQRPDAGVPEVLLRARAGQHARRSLRRCSRWCRCRRCSTAPTIPYRDGAEVNGGIADWNFSAADLRAIENETARKLLPKLKTA